MKPAFRFPLWLVPLCWCGSVLLGSVFELLVVKRLNEGLHAVGTLSELAIKSAIVTSPVMLLSLAAAFTMNRYARGIGKYATGLAAMQLIFGFMNIYMATISAADLGMAIVYTPAYVIEEVGFLPQMLLYCAGGSIVHGAALFVLHRKPGSKERHEETIDQ